MEMSPEVERAIAAEAAEVASRGGFSYEDAKSALARSFKYFMDTGREPTDAIEGARDLVAQAVYQAPRMGFENLRGAVDYMLFSTRHRVQSMV